MVKRLPVCRNSFGQYARPNRPYIPGAHVSSDIDVGNRVDWAASHKSTLALEAIFDHITDTDEAVAVRPVAPGVGEDIYLSLL